jgi:hypothetical protein
MPRLALALVASALFLLAAAPAGASFFGTNGKVAWLTTSGALMVDDPYDEAAAAPLANAAPAKGFPDQPGAYRSPPAWSPDGTRIAYTEALTDTSPYPDHSAVFVINADGSGRKQVSHPFAAVVPSCDVCDDGERTYDYSPVWKDDNTLAFIRFVIPDDEATHVSIGGTSVWTVGVDGGGESMLKHVHKDTGLFQSIVWPNTWSEPISVFVAKGIGFQMRKVVSQEIWATELGFTDVDASPDGQKIVYGAATASGQQLVVKEKDGTQIERFSTGLHQAKARFTPDNNGLIREGCAKDRDGVDHCGFITHRIPDPDADVREDDPVELPYVDMDLGKFAGPDQPGMRGNMDIQGQDLPLIYVPGFLGSEIQCDGSNVWMPLVPPLVMGPMSLTSDGKGNQHCPSAGPTGKPVDKFLGADVYGHADDWLEAMHPEGGWKTYGWDWRKAPQESLAEFDALIDQMLTKELLVKQGTKRVSLVGHSYGGLLIRAYIDEEARAKKVGRVLTVGSPYHGSAKPIFGSAFGVELPSFGALDAMIVNADMKAFMVNLSGAYHLFPSDNYGGWLTVNQKLLDQTEVANFVQQTGGNAELLGSAFQTHRDMLDGFYDRKGKIDYRAVTGIGLLTVGKVNLLTDPMDEDKWIAGVHYEDGDGTVPGRSATQGPIGTSDPMGDDVHIQNRCGIAHMDQTKDKVVQGAYAQFLIFGRLPRKLPATNCKPQGKEIEVYRGLEIPAPTGGTGLAPAGRAAAGGPMPVQDAAFADLVDVMELPGRTLIVTDDSRSVPLSFEGDDIEFAVTAIDGSARGRKATYGPLSGDIVVDDGDAGLPVVTVDGQPVAPVTDTGAGGDGGGDGDGDGDGGGDGGGAGGEDKPTVEPTPVPTASPTPAPTAAPTAEPTPVKVVIATKKAKARKGVVTIKLTAGGPFSGNLVLTAKKLGRIGSAKVALTKAGTVTVKVKLSAKARRAKKLAAVAALGGATAKLTIVR